MNITAKDLTLGVIHLEIVASRLHEEDAKKNEEYVKLLNKTIQTLELLREEWIERGKNG